MQESAAALDITEKGSSGTTGWAQFEERSANQVLKKNIAERDAAKCQNMEMLPCFFPPPITTMPTTTTSVVTHRTRTTQLLTPDQIYNLPSVLNREGFNYIYHQEINADPRTLDLFPHKRDNHDQDAICLTERKSMFCSNASMDSEITSNQFFEFLPLRN